MTHQSPCKDIESGAGCAQCDSFLDELAKSVGHEESCDYGYKATYEEAIEHLRSRWPLCDVFADASDEPVPGVQVGIEVAGEPVSDEKRVRTLLNIVGLDGSADLFAVDAEFGVWAVTVPAADWATLQREGFIEWTAEVPFGAIVSVTAEMP